MIGWVKVTCNAFPYRWLARDLSAIFAPMFSPVDRDIELAAAIGRCSNEWAHAEYQLTILFSILTGMDLTKSATVFSFFKSTRTQSEVLKKVARVTTCGASEEALASIAPVLKQYEKIAADRNRLIHNPIGISEQEKTLYLMTRRPGLEKGEVPYQQTLITQDEIDALTDDIRAFNLSLLLLTHGVAGIRLGEAGQS